MPQKLLCISRLTNDKKQRTADVLIRENIDFAGLMLRDDVLTGLKRAGFKRPSPIQLKAIPLGRCGLDLIIQAKSGTGKTCVFAVVALESICVDSGAVQVLVLAPTREIAVQLWEVINTLGNAMTALRCYTFIGGLPLSEDVKKLQCCHIVVGTPGRVKQLIEENLLDTSTVRLFVMDEADKLLEDNFQQSVNWIYSALPENKQMLAVSATYPETLALHLRRYMRNPTFVRLNITDPALLGIRQYYEAAAYNPQKAYDNKGQSLSDTLNAHGWPAAYISSSREQQDRLAAMAQLKKLQCRVLVSTDLTARGIDADHVNLVVNLDLPHDHETYLHRIGRAGRFGTYGAAVSFVCVGPELDGLRNIAEKCGTKILQLPDPIPVDLAKSSGFLYTDDLVTTEQIFTDDSQACETLSRQDTATQLNSYSSVCANSTECYVGMLDKLRKIVKFGKCPSPSKGSITFMEAAADFKRFMAAKDADKMLHNAQCHVQNDAQCHVQDNAQCHVLNNAQCHVQNLENSAVDVPFLELVENVSSLLGTLTHSEDSRGTAVTSCPARPVDSGIVISDMDSDSGQMGMSADRPMRHKMSALISDADDANVVQVCSGIDKDGGDIRYVNGDSHSTFSCPLRQSKSDKLSSDNKSLNTDVEFCIGCKKQFVVLPDVLSPLPSQPEIGFFTCDECAEMTSATSQMFTCDVDDCPGTECVQRLYAKDLPLVEESLSDSDSHLLEVYQSMSSCSSNKQSPTESEECCKCDTRGDIRDTCDDTCCRRCVSSGDVPVDTSQGCRKQAVTNSQTGHHHRGGEDAKTTEKPSHYQEKTSHMNQTGWHRPTTDFTFRSSWSPLSNYGNDSETWSKPTYNRSAAKIDSKCCDQRRAITQQFYAQACYENYMYHLKCAQYYKDACRQIEHGERMMGIYTSQKHYIEQMGKFAARRKKNYQS